MADGAAALGDETQRLDSSISAARSGLAPGQRAPGTAIAACLIERRFARHLSCRPANPASFMASRDMSVFLRGGEAESGDMGDLVQFRPRTRGHREQVSAT